jgi:hypothetical protein
MNTLSELVKNPNFDEAELGTPIGWIGVPFVTTISSITNTGTHSLKIESQEPGYSPAATQNIKGFTPDQAHRMKYSVRTDRFGVEYRVRVEFWKDATEEDPTSGQLEEIETHWRQGNGGDWHYVSVDFTPTSKTNRLLLVLQVKGPGMAWFDNISITQVAPTVEEAEPEDTTPVIAATAVHAETEGDQGVRITEDHRFVVHGRPFFPIQIWGWTPYSEEALKAAHDFGYNIVASGGLGTPTFAQNGPIATRLWLDAAQRQGIYAMVPMAFNIPPNKADEVLAQLIERTAKVMPVLRDHPATFGYNINDEPAWGGTDVASHNKAAKWIKAEDPNHLIFINHAPQNTIEEIKQYNPHIDISGSDIYPIRADGIGLHSSLPNNSLSVVGDETRKNLEAVDNKKPVMQTLQGFSWSAGQPGDKLFPTHQQSRFMAWDSIVAGATGIAWFQDERYSYLHPDIKPIVREFASLQDVLAGGKIVATEGVFAAPIQSLAYEWKGKTVLVALNPTDQSVQLAPNWKPAFGGANDPLRVLWENRNSATTENFAPFDVHIYTDAAKDEEILRAGFDVEPTLPSDEISH